MTTTEDLHEVYDLEDEWICLESYEEFKNSLIINQYVDEKSIVADDENDSLYMALTSSSSLDADSALSYSRRTSSPDLGFSGVCSTAIDEKVDESLTESKACKKPSVLDEINEMVERESMVREFISMNKKLSEEKDNDKKIIINLSAEHMKRLTSFHEAGR